MQNQKYSKTGELVTLLQLKVNAKVVITAKIDIVN